MSHLLTAGFVMLAQAPAPSPGGGLGPFVPIIIVCAIFYFMLLRPQQRKEKERKQMINDLKSGTKVIFGGGMIGTVTNVKEHTFTIKIADGVKVEVIRGAVSRVIEKGEKAKDEEDK